MPLPRKADSLGFVILLDLRLLDLAGVKMTDAGEVEGAESLIAGLKTAKPYLFGSASSSSTAAAPRNSDPSTKQATEMTQDEWRAARAKMLSRR